MTSRRLESWVWWLLPLLVARALMPVGFMPQVVHGQMQIVLCQGGVAKTVSVAAESSADTGTDAGANHWQHDLSCPYGHAAVAPPPMLVVLSSAIPRTQITLPLWAEPPYDAVGPPRFIATRGPPRFA